MQLDSSTLQLFGAAGDVIKGSPGGEPNIGEYGTPGVALLADDSSVLWSGVSFQTGGVVPVPDGAVRAVRAGAAPAGLGRAASRSVRPEHRGLAHPALRRELQIG